MEEEPSSGGMCAVVGAGLPTSKPQETGENDVTGCLSAREVTSNCRHKPQPATDSTF
jgi:hypothetical protein